MRGSWKAYLSTPRYRHSQVSQAGLRQLWKVEPAGASRASRTPKQPPCQESCRYLIRKTIVLCFSHFCRCVRQGWQWGRGLHRVSAGAQHFWQQGRKDWKAEVRVQFPFSTAENFWQKMTFSIFRFAFQIYDVDGDGFISREELFMVINSWRLQGFPELN